MRNGTITYNDIKAAADYVRSRLEVIPETAIILGSGLGYMAEDSEAFGCY